MANISAMSILNTIKQSLGIEVEETSFDNDLIMHINTVFSHLYQLGVGPKDGYEITSDEETWGEYLNDEKRLNLVKTFMCLKVKMVFDPPSSATVLNAYTEQCKELEWRIYIFKDGVFDEDTKVSAPTKTTNYLYELNFDNLDYTFGKKWVEENYKVPSIGCSSVHKGNLVGRNLDFFYCWDVDTIIRVKSSKKHYASIGVSSAVSQMTKEYVEKNQNSDLYKALPFTIVDGINENGVYVSTNIIAMQKGKTIGTTPLVSKKDSICMSMLPRYILDHYASAQAAVEGIRDYISVYGNKRLWDLGMEAHFMIADPTSTYVLEFVNNEVVIHQDTHYLTNFFVHDVTFNADGTVYSPETQDATHNAIITNNIQEEGQGLERWNVIVNNYSNLSNLNAMIDLMKNKLNYNNSYTLTENVWYTEFTGQNSQGYLTVASPVADFDYILSAAREMFKNRNRDAGHSGVWHTTHTCIYDLLSKTLYLYDSSEDGVQHKFSLWN